jgi:hypothetical protein
MSSWRRRIEPRCRAAEPRGQGVDLLALTLGDLRRFPRRFGEPLPILVAKRAGAGAFEHQRFEFG